MGKELVDELGPPGPPTRRDYDCVRQIISDLESRDDGMAAPLSLTEQRRFWRSFDRIWPGPNRWDYRLLTFLAGAAFVFAVEFAVLMALDFTNAVRPRSDTIRLHLQALAEQVETSLGHPPF